MFIKSKNVQMFLETIKISELKKRNNVTTNIY